jgi:Winged helix DNA-binding domain
MFSGVKLNKARCDHEHEDREAVLSGALKGYVYRPQGWLSPVVLVDGRMEGVWRHERRGDRLSVEIEWVCPVYTDSLPLSHSTSSQSNLLLL